jgi:maltooligosyltrehalose trehalohydrolase
MPFGRGAAVGPDGAVQFAVWAPYAERVTVRIVSGVRPGEWSLAPGAHGVWEAVVEGVGAGADYLFRLTGRHGTLERPDPVSRHQPDGVHGPSRVVDPRGFSWSDAEWRAPAMADLILYELHVGTFTPAGTFDAAVEDLPRLRDLGINALELMPVAEFPGGRNWGYDGVYLYAPQSTYGGPDGLRRLVDAAHAIGIAVVLDVVYNHVGPEGSYLGDFGPYFTDRYRTPWGPAVNFDGPDSDEVRRWVVDNARYWVEEFHLDGLRLDAVHAIYDSSPVHIVAEIAAAAGDRWIIVETDTRDAGLVRERDAGGFGATAKWSDDFHHALHVALTGEHTGYYAGYHGLDDLATTLEAVFARGPAAGVPPSRFVGYAQNHDQVGNRAAGDRLVHLVGVERAKVAAALVLTAPFVPMLFQGEEWAASTPFQYFTDHRDERLARSVSEGRRREFAAFGWAPEDVPDPQAPGTFERSKLRWDERGASPHAEMLAWYQSLIALRRSSPSLRAADTKAVADARAGTLVVRRGEFTVAVNLGSAPASVGATGSVVLASQATIACHDGVVDLPPDSVAVLRR